MINVLSAVAFSRVLANTCVSAVTGVPVVDVSTVLLVSLLWLASLMPLPFLLSAATVFWLAPILLHCAAAVFIPDSASVPIAGGVLMLLVLMLALQALLL